MKHDHQCLVLAAHLLNDEAWSGIDDAERLADHIQRAAEDWIESARPTRDEKGAD